jgi:hypothetical protein
MIGYDFVGHQETLHEDAEHVLGVLRGRKPPSSPPLPSKYAEVRFPDSDASRGYNEDEIRRRSQQRQDRSNRYTKQLLSQLTDDTRRRLLELYAVDYELFGFERPQKAQSVSIS